MPDFRVRIGTGQKEWGAVYIVTRTDPGPPTAIRESRSRVNSPQESIISK